METTSSLVLLLVLLFSVSGVRATVENSEDDFEENNHRVDAEQDPYTNVTLAAKSGDATSTLFRSCLDSSRTFDAKFASIDSPGGITYTRYVPDSSMLAFPVKWENAVGSVSDIFGCVSKAEAGGYSMFKYSASGCKLAKQGYNLETVPECEDNEADAVFIKPALPGSCAFPSVAVGPGNICFLFTDTLMTRDSAESFCVSNEKTLYAAIYDADTVNFVDVVAKLKELGYTRNMWANPKRYVTIWDGGFRLENWVNGTLPTDGSSVDYMDSQAGWKLRGGQKSDLAGAACLPEDEPA